MTHKFQIKIGEDILVRRNEIQIGMLRVSRNLSSETNAADIQCIVVGTVGEKVLDKGNEL
jgi:hypothetical protein